MQNVGKMGNCRFLLGYVPYNNYFGTLSEGNMKLENVSRDQNDLKVFWMYIYCLPLSGSLAWKVFIEYVSLLDLFQTDLQPVEKHEQECKGQWPLGRIMEFNMVGGGGTNIKNPISLRML